MSAKTPVIIFFVLNVVVFQGKAQDDVTSSNVTDSEHEVNKRKEAPKSKRLLQIIRNDTRGILYGNKCFEEVTHDMGFEYVVQPKGQPRNGSNFSRFLHNFGVKTAIFFKNGPFWKFKVKKRRRECQEASGDFTG